MFLLCWNSIAQAEKYVETTTVKLLPYFEAESELDSTDGDELLIWVTPDKVIFGTFINSHLVDDPSYCGDINPRPDCTKPTFDRTKNFLLFDLTNRKTEFNIKNKFYQKQLDAFEQHQSYDFRRCPYDKEYKPNQAFRTRYIRLKSNDGCIREEYDSKKIDQIFYVRPDGKSIPLEDSTDKDNIRFWAWIDWLNVYILGTHISLTTSSDSAGKSIVISPSTARLFTLDGKLKFVELGGHALSEMRPTRAGMIAGVDVYSNVEIEKRGLTLWHDGKRYKIADSAYKTEVSPDGCHVAYLATRRVNEMRNGILRDITYSKLRVIDVCVGFAVEKDANPFATLLEQ